MNNNFEKVFSTTKKLAILTGLLILFLACLSSANAAVVNATPSDNIQQVINNQLDPTGNNTLNLAAGDYQGEFTGYNIVANRNINFVGAGNSTRFIGDKQHYLFYVQSGCTVSFINITFIDGNGTNSNIAGAINNQGTLTVQDCKFYNNTGADGGAIRSDSPGNPVNIINSEFDGNSANVGGALCIVNSDLNVKNSIFNNNSANDAGGAIYLTANNALNIQGTDFTNNQASNIGGAVFTQENSKIILNRTNFNNNSANHGSAILLSPNSIIDIINSIFDRNNASYQGTVSITDGGNFTVTGSNFTNNYAYYQGSAILAGNSSKGYINNSKFESNSLDPSQDYSYGTVFFGNGNLTVENSNFNNRVSDIS